MSRLSKKPEEIKDYYDVVIVGSGYGGGVSACRLAEKGLSVCVLERGKEWQTGDFPDRFPDIRAQMHVTGGKMETGSETGLFHFKIGKDVHVLTGGGLGGGSLVNAAVALQPDAHVFEDAAWPDKFRAAPALIERSYDRAKKMLRPNAHGQARDMIKFKALEGAEKALEGQVVPTPVVIHFEDSQEEKSHQPACTLCGDCCSGCNVGAKNTIALTYLPRAVAAGADIFVEMNVQYIAPAKGEKESAKGWEVFYRPSDAKKEELSSLRAGRVILAAGTLGSSEILLRSREKGLSLSQKLGQGFSANGDIIAFGYDADREVNAVGVGHPAKIENRPVGASVSGHLELKNKQNPNHSMIIEEGVLPSALGPLLPVFFVPGGRLLGALKSLVKGVYAGPLSRTQTFFAVSHDDAEGVLKLHKDRLVIEWPEIHRQPVYERVDEALKKTTEAIGGSYVKNPLASTVMGAIPATAHPLGGCAMGNSATDGVVNHRCEVFTGESETPEAVHRGLYVIDGSVLPRSLGVNPLLTITAISERAMELFETQDG